MNNYIPDCIWVMRYTRFQDVLQLVVNAGRNFVIMKRHVKDAFKNVLVAL